MITCLLGSRMNMTADIWVQSITQNPESGAMEREWKYDRTVPCIARGVVDGGIRVAGTTEYWEDNYEAIDFVFLRTKDPLSRRVQITNIRDSEGHIIWVERDLQDEPPVTFDAKGSTPVIDPFGKAVEYQTLLQRAEVQTDV